MAKRKIKTFGLDKEIVSKLTYNNFQTVEDVLSKPFLQLMTILRLSASETEQLLSRLSSACLPLCYSAFQLLEKEKNNNCVLFGDHSLDRILQGGLKKNVLTEIAGPAGVGKTQMCLHLSLQCLKSRSTCNAVCYIDTEGAFRSERLVEMLEHNVDTEERLELVISNLHVFRPTSIASLSEIFQSLELFCIEKDVSLLVIDSVASLVRKEFSQISNIERSSVLASWAAQIKSLADQLNIAVLVTNQVTSQLRNLPTSSKYEESVDEDTEACVKSTFHIGPALGNTWTHFVNTRIILQFLKSDTRQLIIAKSPVAPFATKEFTIDSSGIRFNETTCFTYDCVDPNSHKIKVDPGLKIS